MFLSNVPKQDSPSVSPLYFFHVGTLINVTEAQAMSWNRLIMLSIIAGVWLSFAIVEYIA